MDMILDICESNYASRPLRIARIFFLIENSRQSRANFTYYVQLIPKILKIVLFTAIYVCTYGLIGAFLFQNSQSGAEDFSSLSSVCINLFELLTTVVYPDIALNAWTENKWFALYYVFFLIFGNLFLLNLFFSEVFSSYREFCKIDYISKISSRKYLLSKSFIILSDEKDLLIRDDFFDLISMMYPFATISSAEKVLGRLCSKINSSFVKHDAFLNLLDIISLEIPGKEKSWRSKFVSDIEMRIRSSLIVKSILEKVSHFSKIISSWRFYSYFPKFLVCINCINLFLMASNRSNFALPLANIIITVLFSFEFIIDFSAGNSRKDYPASIRMFVQMLLIVCSIFLGVESVYSLFFQSCMIFRLFSFSPETDHRIHRILKALKFFMINLLFVLVVMYAYAIVGMSLFSGLLNADNSKLDGSLYAKLNYYSINFNSFVESWFTLFHFLVVNNWNITESGLVAVRGKWASLYPISFNIIVVTIMLDVVVTFFLDIQVCFYIFAFVCIESFLE
jgi:hypothetical protein